MTIVFAGNITKKICVKYGQQEDVDKKFTKFDEVVSLIQQALKEPENSGTYEDYSELCKLYDKNSNGTMMVAELELIGGEEDEDGFIPYKPFLDKLCGKVDYKAAA